MVEAAGGSVPGSAALLVSLASLAVAGLGTWLSNRAQNKSTVIQARVEEVKSEQEMIKILRTEVNSVRDDWREDIETLKKQHIEDNARIREECFQRLEDMRDQLNQEREAHDRTRHRYLEDVTALRLIVRDEVSRAAAQYMDEDVRELIRENKPTYPEAE